MARFKRSLRGYRRRDVDAAFEQAEGRIADLDRELLILSEMMVGREREADALREQLSEANARHDRSLRSLQTLATQMDEMRAQARGQATRIRMVALSEAVKVTERASDALGAIQEIEQAAAGAKRPGAAESAQAQGEEGAVSGPGPGEARPAPRLGGDAAEVSGSGPGEARPTPGFAGAEPDGPEVTEVEFGARHAAGGVSGTGGNGAQENGAANSARENGDRDRGNGDRDSGNGGPRRVVAGLGYFQGDVEVEIGPLGDFSQLLGFESAAGGIEGAREISVRRFASGRATLGMRLDEPIELLRELEERAPFEFHVRQTGGDRVVLDIDDEPTAEAS